MTVFTWLLWPVAYQGGGVSTPPPRNSEGPPKSCQTQPDCEKLLKTAEFKTPTPQDVLRKGSKILKLPPVGNCFTLAMTNKLVVIINSLKVPKIKKILLYEMKFLVPNYSCLQNHWLGDYRPQIPFLSVLNWICWTPPTPEKIPGYATASDNAQLSVHLWERYFKTEFIPLLIHSCNLVTIVFLTLTTIASFILMSFHSNANYTFHGTKNGDGNTVRVQ